MSKTLTDEEFEQAMAECAAEPVHIPGLVQPFGCLIAIHRSTEIVAYASENCGDLLGMTPADLFGKHIRDTFGSPFAHDLRNATSRAGLEDVAAPVQPIEWKGTMFDVSVSSSGEFHVVEFAPDKDPSLGSADSLKTLNFLMSRIGGCDEQERLLSLTTDLLRHLTGYDRVLAMRFDRDFNGEVMAESRKLSIDPLLGLRFPHWDIPEQARAIMKRLPLRFIADVDQDPAPILAAASAELPPLDITLAACRGVSKVHMQYLRNAGWRATMTLSIVIDGKLWGMISFHHQKPHVPAPRLCEVLCAFMPVFTTKLLSLRQRQEQELIARVDQVSGGFLDEIDNDLEIEQALPRVAPTILDAMEGCGLASLRGDKPLQIGRTPGPKVLKALSDRIVVAGNNVQAIESLESEFPELQDDLNGCAGVLVASVGLGRAVAVFREPLDRTVSWAGRPTKDVDISSGKYRVSPRHSFDALS